MKDLWQMHMALMWAISPEMAAEQRRARLLADSDTNGYDYDLALALGYEPESWDGMFKLTAHEPFRFEGGKVIATEIVTDDQHKGVVGIDGETLLTREVTYDVPAEFRAQAPIYCQLINS